MLSTIITVDAVKMRVGTTFHAVSLIFVTKVLRVAFSPGAFLTCLAPRATIRVWINNTAVL